ncbi:MAG: lipase secretion chaperone [Leptospiraceae bacterium]|nr:lipase secretion chaperone [Leptospiraceae bacterium]
MKGKKVLAAVIFFLGTMVLFLYLNQESDAIKQINRLKRNPPPLRTLDAEILASLPLQRDVEGGYRLSRELSFEEKVALIRQRWGKNIDNAYIQIKMLEDLIRHCQAEGREDWVSCVYELSGTAFPDLSAHLFNQLEALLRYNEWLRRNREDLARLGRRERMQKLMERRAAFFGEEDAKAIFAAELKAETIRLALDTIEENPHMPLEQKLEQFTSAIKEAHGNDTARYMERHRQELLHSFLSLSSVQKDLRQMDPISQKEALRHIRQQMGLDKEALARWEMLDKEREERWRLGKQYLAERESLVKQYHGNPPAHILHELRKKYFGAEAESVAEEEAEGYFRYAGEQRLGID